MPIAVPAVRRAGARTRRRSRTRRPSISAPRPSPRAADRGAELDRDGSGFYITFVVDEGEIYNFGKVDIESLLSAVDPQPLYGEMLTKPGSLYNQSQMDKSVERLTLVVAERGFAFARVRPKASRAAALIALWRL